MGKLSTQSPSHRWLLRFVDWIRPDETMESKIQAQANDIRERIRAKALADGLAVQSMPWSGSFAKKTGLRRHMLGAHLIEGQDVDLPFVLSPHTRAGDDITSLLGRFQSYAQAIYPNTSLNLTKSSVNLDFTGTKLSYDLVPLLAVPTDAEAQILLWAGGERRRTSVQKHIEFIKTRTVKSNGVPGRVKFNEGVRMVKWWREICQSRSQVVKLVPTIVIDLLCAKAFDEVGVAETYTETLALWFGRMADIVRQKKRVVFTDFTRSAGQVDIGSWTVLDPVNPENNVVPEAWKSVQLVELAEWFERARDGMARVIAAEVAGDESRVHSELVALFGNAISSHGKAG